MKEGLEINIIMYHYIRELSRSRYPKVKALAMGDFRKHLKILKKNGAIYNGQDVFEAYNTRQSKLSQPCFWLTFDDGYADHYQYVFPLLHELGVSGTFFPPTKCIFDKKLLDVNAIHFIIASAGDPSTIVSKIKAITNEYVSVPGHRTFDVYWQDNAVANRFDSAEVIFIKRMLQHALPAEIRRSVIDQLFNDIVSVDQSAFAEELYLTPEQIRVMYSGGMEFGSHTHSHPWLDRISLDDQETEISTSIKHLQSINIPMNNWIMCYPYGASSHETRVKSMELGAKLGLGSQVGRAHLDFDDPMRLPRWDANDVLSGTLDLRFN